MNKYSISKIAHSSYTEINTSEWPLQTFIGNIMELYLRPEMSTMLSSALRLICMVSGCNLAYSCLEGAIKAKDLIPVGYRPFTTPLSNADSEVYLFSSGLITVNWSLFLMSTHTCKGCHFIVICDHNSLHIKLNWFHIYISSKTLCHVHCIPQFIILVSKLYEIVCSFPKTRLRVKHSKAKWQSTIYYIYSNHCKPVLLVLNEWTV